MRGSPDYPVLVADLGLDYVPKFINVFLNVEHRQRRGAGDP